MKILTLSWNASEQNSADAKLWRKEFSKEHMPMRAHHFSLILCSLTDHGIRCQKSRFVLIFITMPVTDSNYLDDCLNLHSYHHHSWQLCSTETMDPSSWKVTFMCEKNKGFSAIDPCIWESLVEIRIIMNPRMFREQYKTQSFEITSP